MTLWSKRSSFASLSDTWRRNRSVTATRRPFNTISTGPPSSGRSVGRASAARFGLLVVTTGDTGTRQMPCPHASGSPAAGTPRSWAGAPHGVAAMTAAPQGSSPISRIVRATSSIVAPVVTTSSTITTHRFVSSCGAPERMIMDSCMLALRAACPDRPGPGPDGRVVPPERRRNRHRLGGARCRLDGQREAGDRVRVGGSPFGQMVPGPRPPAVGRTRVCRASGLPQPPARHRTVGTIRADHVPCAPAQRCARLRRTHTSRRPVFRLAAGREPGPVPRTRDDTQGRASQATSRSPRTPRRERGRSQPSRVG